MSDEDGEHQPQSGDRIWSERRKREGKQPNGLIDHVVEWGPDGSVLVHWYANGQMWDGHEEISTIELNGCFLREYNAYQIWEPKSHYWRDKRILKRAGMWPPKRLC